MAPMTEHSNPSTHLLPTVSWIRDRMMISSFISPNNSYPFLHRTHFEGARLRDPFFVPSKHATFDIKFTEIPSPCSYHCSHLPEIQHTQLTSYFPIGSLILHSLPYYLHIGVVEDHVSLFSDQRTR